MPYTRSVPSCLRSTCVCAQYDIGFLLLLQQLVGSPGQSRKSHVGRELPASQHSRALELQALPALQSTRATSSAALPALQSKRRRTPPLDPRLLQPFVSCWYQEWQTVIKRETLLLDSISPSIHIGSTSHVGIWTVLWQLTRLKLKTSEKWQTSRWV